MSKQQYHYITVSLVSWCVNEDLLACLMAQRNKDKGISAGCNVYKIPLPITAGYELEMYQPQVEGAEYIDHVRYSRK